MEHEHKEHKTNAEHHEHKQHAHHSDHIKIKKKNIWIGVSIVLAIILIISLYTNGFSLSKDSAGKGIVKEEAAEKALDYINQYLLGGGVTAELKGIKDENGMNVITIEIQGQEFDSYVTKDGRFLFPQAIDLDEEPQVQQQQAQAADLPKTDKPNVKLFVMSFCPYSQQAEAGLGPAVGLLSDSIEFEPHFVIYSNYGPGYPSYCLDEENKYCSMHGINEVNEDVRQLCIWKYNKESFWDYLSEINSKCSLSNIESCWEDVAASLDLDVDRIKRCHEEEAISLLEKEVELNDEYGVDSSPEIKINDVDYAGARSSEGFKTSICSAFTTSPEECGEALSTTGAAAAGTC